MGKLIVDVEKLRAFLLMNEERGVILREVAEHFGVQHQQAKNALKRLEKEPDSERYLAIVKNGRKVRLSGKPKPLYVDDRQKTELDNQETKLDNQKTELDNQKTELDNQEPELDNQKTELDNQEPELDNQETKLDNQETKLDNQETEADNQETKAEIKSHKTKTTSGILSSSFVPAKSISILDRDIPKIKLVIDSSILEMPFEFFAIALRNLKQRFYVSIVVFRDTFNRMLQTEHKVSTEILTLYSTTDGIVEVIPDVEGDEENFARICQQNNFHLMSGTPKKIAWSKVFGVPVWIPEYFTRDVPNPCKGKNITAFDDTLLDKLKPKKLENAREFWISNTQLKKMQEISPYIAYYGNFGMEEESADGKILFFKKKGVNCYIVKSSKEAARAKVCGLPFEFVASPYAELQRVITSSIIKKGDNITFDNNYIVKQEEVTYITINNRIQAIKSSSGERKSVFNGQVILEKGDIIEMTNFNNYKRKIKLAVIHLDPVIGKVVEISL